MTAHAPTHGSCRWMVPLIATALVAIVGCTTAASPTRSAPVPTPSQVPASHAPVSPAPSPSAAPVGTPPAKPSPSASPGVGLAPTGSWSALHWVEKGTIPLGPAEIQVFGWSGGYVALAQSPGSDDNGNELPVTIRASSSHDGVNWTAPRTLESGLMGMIRIETLVEGPSGLLALAYHYGDTCGGPEPVTAMWSSPDGQAWQRLPLPKPFTAGGVETIAGGPAGFIALGTKTHAGTPAIWTSRTGVDWAARPLPTVSSGTLVLDGVASFADGFLLVGSVLGEGGCGGPAHVHPAIWFSADGSSWSRTTLPQASTNANTSLAVRRFGNQLLAVQDTNTDKAHAWTSTDGRTWSRVADVSPDVVNTPTSDGAHALTFISPDSGSGPATVIGVDPDGTTVSVTQDGDLPTQSEEGPATEYAVGPTGVLAYAADGSGSWLGIPS